MKFLHLRRDPFILNYNGARTIVSRVEPIAHSGKRLSFHCVDSRQYPVVALE